ncbi:exopolysaccharide biosynthesis protein, partial [Escherichia coli]|nr:exopolysaccharide biosynthesis protein [Escherichia coli]
MSDLTPRKTRPSLLERAAATYDFGTDARAPYPLRGIDPPSAPIVAAEPPSDLPPVQPKPMQAVAAPRRLAGVAAIDRALLAERGLLVPGAAIGALAEEFRLVKRQLLATARTVGKSDAELSRLMLVSSARPNDGKTYCAV